MPNLEPKIYEVVVQYFPDSNPRNPFIWELTIEELQLVGTIFSVLNVLIGTLIWQGLDSEKGWTKKKKVGLFLVIFSILLFILLYIFTFLI